MPEITVAAIIADILFRCLEIGLEDCPLFEESGIEIADEEAMLGEIVERPFTIIDGPAVSRSVTIHGKSFEIVICEKA